MAALRKRAARKTAALGFVMVLTGACGPGAAEKSAVARDPETATTVDHALVAPKTTPAQDAQYFTDLARADPTLSSYVNTYGNVALKALITDGSAFCAFLARGGGVDNAMASVVIGANGVEDQTHLPGSVATFNAIDAVALITLCPDEMGLLPSADQSRIRSLKAALGSSG